MQRGRLQEIFPVAYKASRHKEASIAEMIENGRWKCIFRRSLNANERLEWDLLCRDIPIPTLEDGDDEVIIFENFSSNRCYELLSGDQIPCDFNRHLWKTTIPNKVSFILWASFHDFLPTRDMLSHRGIQIDGALCVLSGGEKETTDHMFMHCSLWYGIISSRPSRSLGLCRGRCFSCLKHGIRCPYWKR
ncbi:uncharacterized protein LOC113313046 [Papaver somniferum]|uniref:uncharacterized protein LOC113313046 n=1 Tax=Papaver somniferum TaxID=3469 RepID=UPI000E6F880C|nr:uncharacterized protein LOC113313046 [Papaver somniferum]